MCYWSSLGTFSSFQCSSLWTFFLSLSPNILVCKNMSQSSFWFYVFTCHLWDPKPDFIFCSALRLSSVPQYSWILVKVTRSGGTFNVAVLFQSILIFRDLSQRKGSNRNGHINSCQIKNKVYVQSSIIYWHLSCLFRLVLSVCFWLFSCMGEVEVLDISHSTVQRYLDWGPGFLFLDHLSINWLHAPVLITLY